MIFIGTIDPRSLIGTSVSGNNIRHLGVLVDFALNRRERGFSSYQVQWLSGKLEWVALYKLTSLDQEIAGLETHIAQVQAAKARALRVRG